MFRKLIAATGLLAASFSMASAADLRMPIKAPPILAPIWSWTGFYIGLNGGYSWGRGSADVSPITALVIGGSANVNGGIFGGQIGYNWQVDRSWVVGLEADGQWSGERGSADPVAFAFRAPTPGNDFNVLTTGTAASSWKLPWFATFRGRAGLLVDPQWLFYGTAGLAVGDLKYATLATVTTQLFGPGSQGTTPQGPPFTVFTNGSETRTRVGWTAGAGTERKFDKNWSGKLEYLYVDLGRETYFSNTASAASVRFHDHILRGGINYAFQP